MVSLTPIETLGYDLAFFKLPEIEDNGAQFTYYLFDTAGPPALAINWNLVGLHQRSSDPLLLDVQIMHIGDDELSLDAFDPRYADPFLWVNSTEFLALIQFFEERLVDRQRLKATRSPAYFHLLDAEELRQLRLPLWNFERELGDYYRYTPGETVQSAEKMSLMHFPLWSSGYNSASLTFVTFERARLADPGFSPFDPTAIERPGMMTFDQGAFEEFIQLLKEHTYERMVNGL
jgi:hypothetical protein